MARQSKKWFNELSKEQKKVICDKLDITEEVLKKSGFVNEDNNVRIDLLKVSYENPSEWNQYLLEILPTISSYKEQLLENPIEFISSIYKNHNDVKLKTYKDNIHNSTRLQSTVKYITNMYHNIEIDDRINQQEYYAYTIFAHCELFLKDCGMLSLI